jgi:hypothetical protein
LLLRAEFVWRDVVEFDEAFFHFQRACEAAEVGY